MDLDSATEGRRIMAGNSVAQGGDTVQEIKDDRESRKLLHQTGRNREASGVHSLVTSKVTALATA